MNVRDLHRSLLLIGLCSTVSATGLAQSGANPDTGGVPGVDSDGDGVDDNIDAEPCDPRVTARVIMPADRTWGMMMFEDMWPERGDFDFNDVVLAYNETLDYDATANLRGLRVDLRVMAVGARNQSALSIRIPGLPASSVSLLSLSVAGQGTNATLWATETDAVVTLAPDVHALFGAVNPPREWVNTDVNLAAKPYVDIVLVMEFAPGTSVAASEAPFDVFISNPSTGAEVHLPRYSGTSALNTALVGTGDDASTAQRAFVTSNGVPFALEFPERVVYPKEGVAIDQLFSSIVQFGSSNGTQATDFFRNPTSGAAFGNVDPGSLSAAAAVDVSCFLPDPGTCGTAAGTGSVDAPAANLCSFGAASAVSTSGGLFRWTCTGNYSAPIACETPDWVCQPNVSYSCSVSNGAGTQACNGSGTGYNSCTLTSCNAGYYASGNTCVAQVCTPNSNQACTVSNGSGSQTCNNIGSGWGGCTVTSCDSGYTLTGGACQYVQPNGTNVYYQCANVSPQYGSNTGYVVFVENVDNLRTNTPQELLDACIHYGFKGLASSDSRTHRNIGWGTANSSQIHQAVYCHNCYPSSGNEWYYNRSSHNSCTHVSGVATGTRGKNMATYIYNSDDTTFACMTFDEDLDSSTAFGNGSTSDANHPWYTESSGQDPCNRTRVQFGDHYDGTPDYLLCASQTIQN